MTGITLHLMRHGITGMAGRLLGHHDAPPHPDGVALCVDRARPIDCGRILTSDLSRARIPAEFIAAEKQAALHVDPRWRELDFGAWDCADAADLPAGALTDFWADPDGSPPPGGECWSSLRARVSAALGEIDAPALVLTHAGAMRAALSVLCGLDHRQVWTFDLPHGALLSLRLWPDGSGAQITGLAA
ncbi:Phosphoglycerate mutase [Sphingomonas paucimobilis]|nr:Phosphoglycerate mutase [Sphingomonas paucimobilis]